MRKQFAVTLTLAVALAGLPLSGGTHGSGLAQTRIDTASAASQSVSAASGLLAAGGGVVRTGPLVTQMISPTIPVPVPGYADIFLAGRTFPFHISDKSGVDYAGRQEPKRLPIDVKAGSVLTINARDGAADNFLANTAPNANGYMRRSIIAIPAGIGVPNLGLSNIIAPIDSLVAVFTGKKPNPGKPPAPFDFGKQALRDTLTISPQLNQVFFVGTGTTSNGEIKRYVVPKGAVYLYLGVLDYAGSSHDNHGQIVAAVTGTKLVPFTPLPTTTPVRVPTTIPEIGQLLPTDTATNTPVGVTPQVPTATPVPGQPTATPVPPSATATLVPGQPTATLNPLQPTPTFVPTLSPTATFPNPFVTAPPSAIPTLSGPLPTPIVQQVSETWDQFQNGPGHSGYQSNDYAASLATATATATVTSASSDIDPNANIASPFYAGRLHQQTVSPNLGVGSVAGGPVLGLNGLYFTSGQEALLRCVWANGSPGAGFTCPSGFTSELIGPLAENDVPAVEPTANTVYFLSHNGKYPTTSGATGTIAAYNPNNGVQYSFFSPIAPLPTAPGVALTYYNSVCYVPTYDPTGPSILYWLNCAPNGTGNVLHQASLTGMALSGAVVVPSAGANGVVVVATSNGSQGYLQAFNLATGASVWAMNILPGGANYMAFQPIAATDAGVPEVVVTTNYGIGAYNAATGATNWTRTTNVSSSPLGTTCTTGDAVPSGVTLSFAAEDTPAFDPFPTGAQPGSIYVGLPVYSNGGSVLAANELVRINASNGYVCAVGTGSPSTSTTPVSGPPVTDTGAPSTAVINDPTDPRDVVFYADNAGYVYALDAASLAPLYPSTLTHAFPDQARSGIPGITANYPQIGASLVVANGHLYFGNGVGSMFNYSF